LHNVISNLEQKKIGLEQKLEETSTERKKALEEEESKQEALRKELEEVRGDFTKLQEEKDSVVSESIRTQANLKQSLQNSREREAELMTTLKQLDALNESKDQIAKAFQEAETRAAQMDEDLCSTKDREQKLQEQIKVMEASLVKEKEERIAAIKEAEEKLAQANKESAKRAEQLEAQTKTMENELSQLSAEKSEEVKGLEDKLKTTMQNVAETERKWKNQITILEQELTKSSALVKEGEAAQQEKNAFIAILESQIDENTSDNVKICEMNQAILDLKLAKVSLETKTTQQALKIREMTKELESTINRHQDVQRSMALENEEIVQSLAQQLKEKLAKAKADNDAEMKSMKEELEKKSKALQESQAEIKKLVEEVSQAQQSSNNRGISNATLLERVNTLEATVKKYKLREESLQLEVDELQGFTSRLAEVERAVDKKEKLLEKAVREKAETLRALNTMMEDINAKNQRIEILEDHISDKMEELGNAKLIATSALAKIDDMRNAGMDCTFSQQDVEEIYEEYEEKMNEMNNSMAQLKTRVNHLNKTTTSLAAELEDKKAECVRLESELRIRKGRAPSSPPRNAVTSTSASFSDVSINQVTDDDSTHMMESPISNKDSSSDFGSPEFSDRESSLISSMSLTDSNSTFDAADGNSSMNSFELRRQVEKDALKKYMVHRYMKANSDEMAEI